jgi:hypothetical protein
MWCHSSKFDHKKIFIERKKEPILNKFGFKEGLINISKNQEGRIVYIKAVLTQRRILSVECKWYKNCLVSFYF